MSLESGLYIIRNGDFYVGRHFVEDLSILPKRVLLLPEGTEAPRWIVQAVDGGYVLKAHGAPTGKVQDKVYALLIEEDEAEKWKIERAGSGGDNVYTIATNDGTTGWVAPTSAQEQVVCRPLIVFPTYPPSYPPNEVFQFIPLDRDD